MDASADGETRTRIDILRHHAGIWQQLFMAHKKEYEGETKGKRLDYQGDE